jgi:hypothetical protein
VIQPLTPFGVDYVLHHLNEHDAEEIRCTVWMGGNLDTVCKQVFTTPGLKWEARTRSGRPAVIGGALPMWPGVAVGWLLGTDDWPKVGLEVTRFVKRVILPELEERGLHRIECRALAGNAEVIRWLKAIGFHEEAAIAQFGQGREDFVLCARIFGHAGPTH